MRSNPEQKDGLSEYSHQLISDTRKTLDIIFPKKAEKFNQDETELTAEALNRNTARTCLIYLLADLNQEEREKALEQRLDILSVIKLAVNKAPLSDEDRQIIEKEIEKAAFADPRSQRSIMLKLKLINPESPLGKFEKQLYESFKQNSEVSEAYTYLHLTDEAH